MSIRPLHSKLIVRPLRLNTVSAGGIVIPDGKPRLSRGDLVPALKGQVVSIGSGRRLSGGRISPLDVSVGDRVLFADFVGEDISIDGVDHKLLDEEHILGVIED